MRLRLVVEHSAGVAELKSRDPHLLESAADAFRGFAFANDADTVIKVPNGAGHTSLKVIDIEVFDLAWEA